MRKNNLSQVALFFACLGYPVDANASYRTGGKPHDSWRGQNGTSPANLFSPPVATNSPPPLEPTSSPTEKPETGAPTSALTSDLFVPLSPTLACPSVLYKSTDIDSSATLYYAVVPSDPPGSSNGLLCGRLEAEHDGWIALAISENGGMIGSEAIIGLPSDDTVLKYDLTSYSGIAVMPDDKQTLTGISITEEDGKTIMEFTKMLAEDGEIRIKEDGVNLFLHARGGRSLGHHGSRLSFEMNFAEDEDVPALSCPDVLSGYTELPYATLFYAIVPSNPPGSGNGLLCGRLEAEINGWISLGFSKHGGMVGSEAVIGLPSDGTVLKYNLFEYDEVNPMSTDKQTLRDTFIDIDEEDMKTIMGFTKLLVEDGEIPIKEDGLSGFLYACGGMIFPATHDISLAFWKNLAKDQIEVESDSPPTVDEVVPPVTEPVVAQPAKDCTKELCDFELDPNYRMRYRLNIPEDSTVDECTGCTISIELIYDGEAWVAIGFSSDGNMIGSEAIIGTPGGNILKYSMFSKVTSGVEPMPENQQTLFDASLEVEVGQTIMKFTKIMKEPGEIEILAGGNNNILGAYGRNEVLATHIARQSVVLNLSSGASEEVITPNKVAWLAHGIMSFLAWGVFVPFAVQSSLLRDLLPKGPIWIKLHKAFNAIAYALSILIFAIAVVYTSKEGGSHFVNGHQKMGLAMLIMASGQIFGGVIRPHNPAPGEGKTSVRKGWEVGHRILGVALLACGFWQMGNGIEQYANKYSVGESHEKLSIAYWVWIGFMSSVMVVGGWYYKFHKSSEEDGGQISGHDAGNKGEDQSDDDPPSATFQSELDDSKKKTIPETE
eukprot:CAMPEP_0172547466 /NCGR_PEP_ID=MMETSP1067-20121228/16995_1 /TAXON_ID=265564 ORGANISM="Thalassiosira punctigera, Strain Tpunct2005C2" /NCGR_SAMPLE_ID=MMETSP1067 /ASSEMBLY_ACC=CAM_ASM_000444 /LENGTH=829 /DNA_ID=CAMNT_0013334551 /DNA_START=42 /DNA_END=2531 /DNA_ORIENTATION=+